MGLGWGLRACGILLALPMVSDPRDRALLLGSFHAGQVLGQSLRGEDLNTGPRVPAELGTTLAQDVRGGLGSFHKVPWEMLVPPDAADLHSIDTLTSLSLAADKLCMLLLEMSINLVP